MEIQNIRKDYSIDGKLVYSCQYHVIFCPKFRRSVFTNGIDTRVKELISSKQLDYKFELFEIEVMPDHVHMLIGVSPKTGIYRTVTKIKGFVSHQLREDFPALKTRLPCLWTNSAFISSVGSVSLETVKQYIENQKNQ